MEFAAIRQSLANLRTFSWIKEKEDAGELTLRGTHFSIMECVLYTLDEDTGEFRKTDYDNFVRYQVGSTPTRFEGFVRRELLREKLITLITSGVSASTGEVTFHHRAENERVDKLASDAAAAIR